MPIRVGNLVRTAKDLPGLPAGVIGRVREVGRLFIAVQFPDGHIAYYAPRQLQVLAQLNGDPPTGRVPLAHLGFTRRRVPHGSHLCLLPASDAEVNASVALYLAAGLKAGDLCFALAPTDWYEPLSEALERLNLDMSQALASGDLLLSDSREYYLAGRDFKADKQVDKLANLLDGLNADAGRKLRGFGRVPAALSDLDLKEWWEYEKRVTPLLAAAQLLGMCDYGPLPSDSAIAEGARATHPYVVSGSSVTALS